MDRRDALKKIGVGSAAVVGASVVVSQPAFAYTAPTQTSPPNLGLVLNGSGDAVNTSLTQGVATCPGSVTPMSPNFTRVEVRTIAILNNIVSNDGSSTYVFRSILSGGSGNIVGSNPAGVPLANPNVSGNVGNIRKTLGSDFGSVAFKPGDSFTITVRTTYRCTYAGDTAESTTNTDFPFTL